MKSKQSGFSLPKFVYHLGHLSRERIDITALSLGGSIARGTAKIVFWGLIAFLFFFLFLALNIALGFALGTWSGESPAIGFLYLAAGYVGLILLTVLLRPLITKIVRDIVARRALAQTQRLNVRLDLIPTFRKQRYNSPSRAMHQRGSYLVLEQARYQTLLLQDKTFPEVARGLTYIRDHGSQLVTSYVRGEAINYATTIPVVGTILNKLGYKSTRHQRFIGTGEASSSTGKLGKFSKYIPYVLSIWEIFAPALIGVAASQAQGFFTRLFAKRATKVTKTKKPFWRR
ncbi:MAG: hypothetical protein HXN23_03425 [Porphyromonas sp.]|uniref:hypothetical protein n=1 Tax=Porphyromonas sp. TaxID=1924944 RepID=UPI001CB1349C|nr:hypothetical protein [Porphyromonas sp.]MBF1405293.1 hypothetical protein [Porphyromonas sp.]